MTPAQAKLIRELLIHPDEVRVEITKNLAGGNVLVKHYNKADRCVYQQFITPSGEVHMATSPDYNNEW